MYRELIKGLEKNFEARMQAKTGWGRREVMEEFRKAVIEELSKVPDPNIKYA